MYFLLSVVSILYDFSYMHVCDLVSYVFLSIIPCKGCSLVAKIQHPSLLSLIRMPLYYFMYDTVLKDPIVKGLMPYVVRKLKPKFTQTDVLTLTVIISIPS
jgi:hypothetical protein